MIETRQVNAAICDGCGRELLGSNDFEPISGVYGEVYEISDQGGSGSRSFFACRKRCTGPAVANALARDDRNTDQGRLL